MLELEEAVGRILAAVPTAAPECVSIGEADGRILAEGVRARIDLPIFDTSSMDGYALRSSEVTRASKEAPTRLKIIGRVAAGERWTGKIAENTCVRLFTGSPLPEGADAVVMQEDTNPVADEFVEVLDSVRPWENIRMQGEDVKKDSLLMDCGERLSAATLMLLAATGCASINVWKRPTVGLLATGSELVEAPMSLSAGQIFESNRIGLASVVKSVGGIPKIFAIATDTLSQTKRALNSALAECDILVTSGGVSVGEFDFIKPAVEAIGGSLDFWKVSIKPGRPFVFGKAQSKLLFGLPGNPVSAFVTFLLLVRPALLRWQGAKKVDLPASTAILAEPLNNPGGRRHFIRVRVDDAGEVHSAGTQASHILSSMAGANGLVDFPPNTSLARGVRVSVLRWS